MKKEQRLWTLLRGGLDRFGHWTRIENLAGDGTPDVNYALSGVEGWLELKCVEELPARANTPVFGSEGLRPDQIEWLVARTRAGGNAHIFARAGPYLMLIPGRYATRFNQAPLSELLQLATFHHKGRMVQPKWQALGRILTERRHDDDSYSDGIRA